MSFDPGILAYGVGGATFLADVRAPSAVSPVELSWWPAREGNVVRRVRLPELEWIRSEGAESLERVLGEKLIQKLERKTKISLAENGRWHMRKLGSDTTKNVVLLKKVVTAKKRL